MDHRVQLTERGHRDPDVDLLPRRDDLHPLGDRRVLFGDLFPDRLDGVHRRVARGQVLDVQVVGVLVRDEYGGRTLDGFPLREGARIQHHDVVVVLDADAGVAELGDPHGPNLVREGWPAARACPPLTRIPPGVQPRAVGDGIGR